MSRRKVDVSQSLRPRLQAALAVVTLAFVGLTARLFQLQILEGEHYARRAERNFIGTLDVEAPRGRIFDAKGRPLATNRPAYTVFVTARARVVSDPGQGVAQSQHDRVDVPAHVIEELTAMIDFVDDADKRQLLDRIEELRLDPEAGRYAAAVRRNLSWSEYARLETRLSDLAPWIDLRESSRRFYPEGESTAFVTGFLGGVTPALLRQSAFRSYRIGDRVGHTGIERQWENYLRGRLGRRSRVVDSLRRTVKDPPSDAILALPPDRDPIPGQDIYLTIDLDLQREAHDALSDIPAGALVALEPQTGRILAMASVPAIDPNRRQQPIAKAEYESWVESPLKPFVDKTVQEHFFPGSTYKVVSALAALEDPDFHPDEEVECKGSVMFGGRRFRDTHRHGLVNLEQAIVQSCNVYFYQLAMGKSLSLERMERFARMLGLGERTGLGINSEVKGQIPTEASEMRAGTYQRGVQLNSAIGQGNVKVTVLQLAVLYSTLANGGDVMTPFLVDRIVTSEGKVAFSSAPQVKSRPPIDAADWERIRRGLVGVVNDPAGTAYTERLENIVVAGKTGTAQVGRVVADKEVDIPGWDTTQDHAWFAAYAPATDPKIVVVAFVEHGGAGADAAAPIAMRVISHYLGGVTQELRPSRAEAPPSLPGTRSRGPSGWTPGAQREPANALSRPATAAPGPRGAR